MAIFNIDACHLFFFLVYTGCHPLERGLTGIVVTRVLDDEWYLPFSLWFSLPCQGCSLTSSFGEG